MIRFLQKPGKTKKIVLGAILLFISATMVISLVPGMDFGASASKPGVYAKVGGHEVLTAEVLKGAEAVIRQQFPKGLPESFRPFVMKSAIERAGDQLITEKALELEAERLGLMVTNEELQEELRNGSLGAELFPKGEFIGKDKYDEWVQANTGLTVPAFEEIMKRRLLFRKLSGLVEGSASLSEAEVQDEYRRKNVKVKFDYAVISGDTLLKSLKPSEAELRAYFAQGKDKYANAVPEKRKAKYIVIDASKAGADAKVSDDDLRRAYDQRKEQYRQPEQVNVRHILVKTPPPGADGKPDEKGVQAARAKAEDLLKQLKAGAKFEDLAKKNSDDPGSAANGGSLGWMGRGRTVPEFETAAFALNKGQLSEIIKTTYGFHILRVDDKQSARVKPFEEVKAELEPAARQEKAAKAMESMANAVQTEARTAGMDKAAARRGLQVMTSDAFSRTDSLPGIGAAPEFMDAAFAVHEKAGATMARTAQGYVIFEVTEIRPPAPPTFELVRDRVEGDFKNERASTLLSQKTKELSDRARALHNLRAAAKETGATVKTSDLVNSASQVPDVGPMSGNAGIVFGMKPGEISEPVPAGRNGLVFAVVERSEPSLADLEKSRDDLRGTLLEKKKNEVRAVYITNLRTQMEKDGKIRINEDEKKRLTGGGPSPAGS